MIDKIDRFQELQGKTFKPKKYRFDKQNKLSSSMSC
jgi:hypothetical protein